MPSGKYIHKTGPRNPRLAFFLIGPSIAYIPLTRGLFSCVDWEDAFELQKRNWRACSDSWGIYARTTYLDNGKIRGLAMHSVIMRSEGTGMTADHRNSKATLLNCKFNLRLATPVQQSCNRTKQSNNTTGFKGVYRRGQKYVAKIVISRKQKHLGIRDTPEEAASLYREAAREIHGEFANY